MDKGARLQVSLPGEPTTGATEHPKCLAGQGEVAKCVFAPIAAAPFILCCGPAEEPHDAPCVLVPVLGDGCRVRTL